MLARSHYRAMNKKTAITTCIYSWWRLYGYHLHKASFSLQQRNTFYLTTKFVENIEKVPPTQSQINNHQPNKLIKQSDEIKSIIQEPDTQDVHNRGQN